MTTRTLSILGTVMVLLVGAYLLSAPQTADLNGEGGYLLGHVNAEKIAKIEIEQSDKSVELELSDGAWTVPARGKYPANASKVRSLLLKIMDLSSSQAIPASEEGMKKLGLVEESIADGRARVRLYDAGGAELGGLYLGNVRAAKSSPQGSPMAASGSGQYVRPLNADKVYIVGLPVSVSAELSNWLDTGVLNILSTTIYSVDQFKGSDKVFSLVRVEGSPELDLEGDIPGGKVLQDSFVSQIRSGLENLSIIDVHAQDSESVKDLTFDSKTQYSAANGLVYSVSTAEKEGKLFAKIESRFDEELAEKLKEVFAKNTAVAETKESSGSEEATAPEAEASAEGEKAEEAKDTEKDAVEETSEPAAKEEAAAPTLELASKEEAEKLVERFSPWIYELAEYQKQKFRRTRDELIKPEQDDSPTDGREVLPSA